MKARLAKKLPHGILPQAFTIASVDNIDMLQPFAMVSCTNKTRSWHGTSLQCVQPLPLTCTLGASLAEQTLTEKRVAISPPVSPKPKKRQRTLKEGLAMVEENPHTLFLVDKVALPLVNSIAIEYTSTLTLNLLEAHSLKMAQKDIHNCMLLLRTAHQENTSVPSLMSLMSLKSYVNDLCHL